MNAANPAVFVQISLIGSTAICRMWINGTTFLWFPSKNLHELTDGFRAERVIGEWIDFYNTEPPDSALAGQTPAEAYAAGQFVDMMDGIALPTSSQVQQLQHDVINRILEA